MNSSRLRAKKTRNLIVFIFGILLIESIRRTQLCPSREMKPTWFGCSLTETELPVQGEMTKAVVDQSSASPTHSTTNQKPLSAAAKRGLSNVHIVFFGDSVTRYQYLSLVYYAYKDTWYPDRQGQDLVNEHTFNNWNSFYNYSTLIFDGKLKCDCFHPESTEYNRIVENRYYQDRQNNLYLTFIQKFGNLAAQGYLKHDSAFNDDTPPYTRHSKMDPVIWTHDWVETIRQHIAKLKPKPDYIVLNAGLWVNNFNDRSYLQAIRQALDDSHIIGIYRTTTRPRTSSDPNLSFSDKLACEVFQYCLDITGYTASLDPSHYWDPNHFYSHVNTKLNEMFLDFLSDIRHEK